MRTIKWQELMEMYEEQGSSQRFQLRLIKELRPLTDMFCKQSGIDSQYWGELKSYLWYGYMTAFETYNGKAKIQTYLSVISRNRIRDFYKKLNNQQKRYTNIVVDAPIEEEIDENEELNIILVNRLLEEAGIVGLDADVFKLKKGLCGNKQLSDSYICRVTGLRIKTVRRINCRNAKAISKYKKENQE